MAEAAVAESAESLEDIVADESSPKETGKREYKAVEDGSVDSKVVSLSKYRAMKAAKAHKSEYRRGEHSEGNSHAGKEDADTKDGAVAIIYFEDPETGYVEAVFEPREDARAKGDFSLIGGTKSFYDSDSRSTLAREATEEVADKDARKAILRAFKENSQLYYTQRVYIEGENSQTAVYAIKITDKKEWAAISHTHLQDGHSHHSNAVTLSLDEIMKGNHNFAYNLGPIIKRFFTENYINNFTAGLGKPQPSSGAHHYSIDSALNYKPIVQAQHYSGQGVITYKPAKGLSYSPAGYQMFKAA